MKYIGVDISKSTFVAAFPTTKGYVTKEFENTPRGIHKFIGMVPSDHVVVMEATGNYCYTLLLLLHQANRHMSLVNPKQIKHFARMMMTVTKTDAKDACMIAQYGEKMNPALYEIPSQTILILKQKRTVLTQLKKQHLATKNLLEAIQVLPYADKSCIRSLEHTISFIEKQIKALEDEITTLANTEYNMLISRLTSIKGIGIAVATALIIATGGFTYFNNAKQFSRYIGVCPTICKSGTSININGHINRSGDQHLRSLLFVAAWTAIRHNSACREMYERMRSQGKPSKVALIAVSNKLIRQCFAIVNSGTTYIDGFVSDNPQYRGSVNSDHRS